MAKYVIQRVSDNFYVARAGSSSSYTRNIERARIFSSLSEAERDVCFDNERIVPLDSVRGLR